MNEMKKDAMQKEKMNNPFFAMFDEIISEQERAFEKIEKQLGINRKEDENDGKTNGI